MLIDEFLPVYDAVEKHETEISAPPDTVYASVRALDLAELPLVRWLMLLRQLPGRLFSRRKTPDRTDMTLEGLVEAGFVLLGERPGQEILLGIVGRFWRPADDALRLPAERFRDFEERGYAKAVWSFSLVAGATGRTRLTTETRVRCFDSPSRLKFRLYWAVVRPFSGLIRKETLRAVKRQTERLEQQTPP